MTAVRRSSTRWPLAAMCCYALLVPWQPVLQLPDGSPLRFAASDAVAPLVFLAALVRPRRRLPPGLTAMAVAIALLALFSTLWSARDRAVSHYALGKTAGLFYLIGLTLAVGRALERGAEPTVLRALARGTFWSAVVGLLAYGAFLRGIPTTLVNYGRLWGTMPGDPNIYCSLIAVSFLIVVADRELPSSLRAVRLAVLGLALLATGSRSGLVGIAAGGAVFALVRARDRWAAAARSLYVLAAAAALAIALLLTSPGAGAARGLQEFLWRTWTVESRLDLYARARAQFAEHPLLGLGVGGFNDLNTWHFEPRESGHFPVHNTYLWAFVDLGLGGGLLVAGLIATGILRCAVAAGRRVAPGGAAVVAAGLVTMGVFNLFVDGFYQRHFWLLMACALGMRPVVERRPARARAPESGTRAPLVWSGAR